MKRKNTARILTALLILICMLQAAGCGALGGPSREEIRERLLLAYQQLENLDYDSALDAFAAVIEIDEKIPEAYVGMARAYSAKGDQGAARETAAKGKEVTEAPYFEDLERMYGKVQDNEDTLKEIAELLREGEEKIPGELEESKSGLLSETLDKLWGELDLLDIYAVLEEDTLIYPVDPQNGIYLILYPDSCFYLGEIRFTPYSDLLAGAEQEKREEGEQTQEEVNIALEDLVLPVPHGQGTAAGFDDSKGIVFLYLGEFKDGYPEDSKGFLAYQILNGGSRYVFRGKVIKGRLTPSPLNSLYASKDVFLSALMGDEKAADKASRLAPVSAVPGFDPDKAGRRLPADHEGGRFDPDFENREEFELFEQGRTDILENRIRQKNSPLPIDGKLVYLQRGGSIRDLNLEHDLYIIDLYGGWGKPILLSSSVVDKNGKELLSLPIDTCWLTDTGFSCYFLADEGTDTPYSGDNIYSGGDIPGDIWHIDYDWEGNETGRTMAGKLTDIHSFIKYWDFRGVSAYSGDKVYPGSAIQAERVEGGIQVTDLEGNSLGTISVEDPSAWNIAINGRLILIVNGGEEDAVPYMFMAVDEI